jgi:hypothetical protein
MTTATETELDRATRDELQPPCESAMEHDVAATRVIHWQVGCAHVTAHDLFCTDCADATVRDYSEMQRHGWCFGCLDCHTPVRLLRVEPLR